MFLSIENPIITAESTFLDRLGLGVETLLLGMLVVFAMLAIIFVCMLACQAVLVKKVKKIVEPEAPAAAAPAPAPAPAAAPAPIADDSATVAAIVAAISAYTGASPSSFRVVSFKRR